MKKLLLLLLLIVFNKIYSQNDVATLNELISKDSSSIPVLFSYPDSIRNAIFITSTYPQGFVRLEEIQKNTSASFKAAVSKYKQSKQKELWEIIRYPELIELLIQNKDQNKNELSSLLKNYPEGVKKSALYFIKNDPEIIIEISNIRNEFELKYKDLVKDFPENVKESYNLIIHKPELVSILSTDIKTSMLLGDLYKRNPPLIKHTADSLNVIMTKKNEAENEEWKAGINKDEGVQKELKKIANEYEQAENYTDDIYTDKDYTININYIPPYPYWAGYPYWIGRPYWYPYPWWYNAGFYWHPNGPLFFLGMPSYHFGWWYYNHPHYHQKYPRASNYFQQHREIYRGSNQGFNRSIKEPRIIINRKR